MPIGSRENKMVKECLIFVEKKTEILENYIKNSEYKKAEKVETQIKDTLDFIKKLMVN